MAPKLLPGCHSPAVSSLLWLQQLLESLGSSSLLQLLLPVSTLRVPGIVVNNARSWKREAVQGGVELKLIELYCKTYARLNILLPLIASNIMSIESKRSHTSLFFQWDTENKMVSLGFKVKPNDTILITLLGENSFKLVSTHVQINYKVQQEVHANGETESCTGKWCVRIYSSIKKCNNELYSITQGLLTERSS